MLSERNVPIWNQKQQKILLNLTLAERKIVHFLYISE